MPNWNRTQMMRLRLEDSLDTIKGRIYYKGRHVIHRDTEIDGGVYLGERQREAIVVDTEKCPRLRGLYEAAKFRANDGCRVRKHKVLGAVYDTVEQAIRYDADAVKHLIESFGVENDGKISIDAFIEEGVGVCRHQALACAAVLELFKRDGFISGKPSIDRNRTSRRGHAWCRYTNSYVDIFILDVAKRYFGRLDLNDAYLRLKYARPEDLRAFQ